MKVIGINEDECVQFMLSYGHNGAIRDAVCREGCVPPHKKLKKKNRHTSKERAWCARIIYKVHSETNARGIWHSQARH
jgi:hypothetical protein